MFDLFGAETPLAVRFFIAFIVVFALIGATAWLVRRFGANRLGGAAARGRQPRLAVIEAGAVDGRRKLVIVRRDNVEHLIMIGGPTDILVEANIVRGQAVNRDVPAARGTGAAETLARAVPLDETTTAWPLAPEPGAPRPRPAALEESLSWSAEPHVPMPPAPPPAPRRPMRAPDTLAGLAHELSRPNGGHAEPVTAAPRAAPTLDIPALRPAPTLDTPAVKAPAVKPAAPQPAAHEGGGDQNLADMAQRLEAALRRPGAPAAAPASPAKPTTPPATPAATPAPDPAQNAGLASAPRIDSVNGARDKAAKPEPAAAPAEGGAAFGSLEQEMASLLGRPSGKQ
jgi:flagellar protein FliO/FliZ